MTLAPVIGAVLVCDDVRKEVTNKEILIGVYSGDIVVPGFPAWINAAVWMEMHPQEVGLCDLKFRLSINENHIDLGVTLEAKNLTTVGVALPSLQLRVDKESELLVNIADGPDWRPLKKKKIIQGQFSGQPFTLPPTRGGGST